MRAAAALAFAAARCPPSPASAAEGVRYKDEIFHRVEAETDVRYGFAPASAGDAGGPLLLDLYEPRGDRLARRPAIVWVHGGGFSTGDKRDKLTRVLAKVFARRGYVTVSINYRLLATTLVRRRRDAPTAIATTPRSRAPTTPRPRFAGCAPTRGPTGSTAGGSRSAVARPAA